MRLTTDYAKLYLSRTLMHTENNYSHMERESQAIIWSVSRLCQFLMGPKFTILTDHMPLVTLFNPDQMLPAIAAQPSQRNVYFAGL